MTPTDQPGAGPTTAEDGTPLDYSPSPRIAEREDWVKMRHPVTKGEATATRKAFDAVWSHKGWEIVDDDTPAPPEPRAGRAPAAATTTRTGSDS